MPSLTRSTLDNPTFHGVVQQKCDMYLFVFPESNRDQKSDPITRSGNDVDNVCRESTEVKQNFSSYIIARPWEGSFTPFWYK